VEDPFKGATYSEDVDGTTPKCQKIFVLDVEDPFKGATYSEDVDGTTPK
jgi:hypothetical protein